MTLNLYKQYLWIYISILRKKSYYIVSYPRSGTTRTGLLLSNYMHMIGLRRPMTVTSIYPYDCTTHFFIPVKKKRILYILRDGRDVIISNYFRYMRTNKKFNGMIAYEENIAEQLPKFIKHILTKKGVKNVLPWQWHVKKAFDKKLTKIKYEEANDIEKVGKKIEKLIEKDIDYKKLEKAINNNSFEKVSGGRKSGEVDNKSFYRKGIIGDWKNYFTNECCELFDFYAGDVLIMAGYEKDRSWVKKTDHV